MCTRPVTTADILVIADTHVLTEAGCPSERTLRAFLSESWLPQRLIVAGDVTQQGTLPSLRRVADILQAAGFAVDRNQERGYGDRPASPVEAGSVGRKAVVVQGNSDRRTMAHPTDFATVFGDGLVKWSYPSADVLAINTAGNFDAYGNAVIQWLTHHSGDARSLVVVGHHPPNELPGDWSSRIRSLPLKSRRA
jgi:3',5'-cyclic AMP phosphodiesterase CpdA